LARLVGHKRGAGRVNDIVKNSPYLGVTTLTLYAFSTENWQRAAPEVEGLMKLFRGYLQNNLLELHEGNVRVHFLGDASLLAKDIRLHMEHLAELTKHNSGLRLNIAINYGGRDEIVRAARDIANKVLDNTLSLDGITEDTIGDHLDTHAQADPDLIIRTAGELRLSNFMTWQSAYSEFMFPNVSWPDFTFEVYEKCLEEFTGRVRQFGTIFSN